MANKPFLFIFLAASLLMTGGCLTSDKTHYNNGITRAQPSTNIEADFLNPPDYAKIRSYWWWLNSNITKECITQDLEAMKANGYGGAVIFDAGSSNYTVARKTEAGPAFLSNEWLELFKHAVIEADRLGLVLSINVQSGWNPGGPSVTPENAMKKITWCDTVVSGPGKIVISLPVPPHKLLYKDILVQAVKNYPKTPADSLGIKNLKIKTLEERIGWSGIYPLYKLREDYNTPVTGISKKEVIDITAYFNDSVLNWEVPEGKWTIIRYGMTCTGVKVSTSSDGWDGLSMDHLSKEALLQYDKDVISKLIETAQSVGNSLQFIHTDSWEMGVANWTDDYRVEFKRRRGYDPAPWLPVLTGRIVENREVSNRFLRDFRLTVADLVAENFYATFSELAHRYGVYTHPESGGPHSAPIDAVRTMGYNDVPMGEFWVRSNTHRVEDAQRLIVKQSASVAHLYGQQFVAAEGPTSIGPQWERPPKDCKNVIDRIFCSGVNRIVWHTFTASPDEYGEPGNEYFAGTHLNRHVTWWNEAKAFVQYLDRVSFMLSQGLFQADALYYYGDDVPDFIFLKEEVTDLGPGYDWDKCSYDVLMDRVKIKNGKIVLPDGMQYSVLVLPDEKTIRLELLEKLEKLVNQGMVLIGPKPEKATGLNGYPECDAKVKLISDRMWGTPSGSGPGINILGKGKVIWGKTPGEVLQSMGIQPDFSFSSVYPDSHLEYIHRASKKEDLYFVLNRLARHGINDTKYRYLTDLPDRYEQVVCSFRVTGKVPELWDPMTGKIEKIAVYKEENGSTLVPLHLNPEGSVFVVFRDRTPEKHIESVEKDQVALFPAFPDTVTEFPAFSIIRNKGSFEAVVSEPGTYRLKWSDGSESEFQVTDPVIIKPVSAPWTLKFEKEWGPSGVIMLDSLESWSDSRDSAVKYYSGKALYSNTFQLTASEIEDHNIQLDLGNVQEIASVKINGKEAGVTWIAPFELNITGLVNEGVNKLEITVVNSWVNRLIGDSYLPPDQRFTKTNVMKFESPDKESFLRKSGLLSDVRIICRKEIVLK
jgi:hypothetical protein